VWDAALTRLEGRVVVLEPLRDEHVDALWDAGRDERIWEWFPITPGDEESFRHHHAQLIAETARGESFSFATLEAATGTPVGSTSFLALRPEHRGLEIGSTWLTPRLWGSGANTEAKYLQLRCAFESLGCMRVELKTDARNVRSRRALEALGAQFEGIHRKHMLRHYGVRDSAWYSVVDDEWPAVKARLEERLAAKLQTS
jgi:RimJ/RimL family protein N-acetyltransferase